jgi:hypothetical protein
MSPFESILKWHEVWANGLDLVSFILVTPELGRRVAKNILAPLFVYLFYSFFVAVFLCGVFSIVLMVRDHHYPIALILVCSLAFYPKWLMNMAKEPYFTGSDVPVVGESLTSTLFFWGLLVFLISRVIGIYAGLHPE